MCHRNHCEETPESQRRFGDVKLNLSLIQDTFVDVAKTGMLFKHWFSTTSLFKCPNNSLTTENNPSAANLKLC